MFKKGDIPHNKGDSEVDMHYRNKPRKREPKMNKGGYSGVGLPSKLYDDINMNPEAYLAKEQKKITGKINGFPLRLDY